MNAIFCKVDNIRPIQSRAQTVVTIELPIELHVDLTAMLYGKEILITLAPEGLKLPYGLVKGEQEEEPAKPAPDGYGHWYTCLYPGWFQNETVMKAFNVNDKEAAQSVIKGGIYAHFGINSMADLQPERFARLMCDRGLYWTLPSLLRVLKIGGEAA
jgi:hypothetical protein